MLSRRGEMAEISVGDTGKGILPKQTTKFFSYFLRRGPAEAASDSASKHLPNCSAPQRFDRLYFGGRPRHDIPDRIAARALLSFLHNAYFAPHLRESSASQRNRAQLAQTSRFALPQRAPSRFASVQVAFAILCAVTAILSGCAANQKPRARVIQWATAKRNAVRSQLKEFLPT